MLVEFWLIDDEKTSNVKNKTNLKTIKLLLIHY